MRSGRLPTTTQKSRKTFLQAPQPKAWNTWLTGSVDQALQLQRGLPPERLAIVATNVRTDEEPVQTRMAI